MKLLVGLGNPGKEYANTRHNIGFIVLDNFDNSIKITKNKFNAYYNIFNDVIFVKPKSYMNLSGIVVKKFVDYYDIMCKDLIVVHDDVDLCFGQMKVNYGGGAGGHKGILSIINELASSDFIRLRIGIGRPSDLDVSNYVLEAFNNMEIEILKKEVILKANYALELILKKGYEKASQETNRRQK